MGYILYWFSIALSLLPYIILLFLAGLAIYQVSQYTGKKSWAHVVVDKQRKILEETLVEIRAIRNLLEDEQKNHGVTE